MNDYRHHHHCHALVKSSICARNGMDSKPPLEKVAQRIDFFNACTGLRKYQRQKQMKNNVYISNEKQRHN